MAAEIASDAAEVEPFWGPNGFDVDNINSKSNSGSIEIMQSLQ